MNDSKDEQNDSENEQPYSDLTPDLMLDAWGSRMINSRPDVRQECVGHDNVVTFPPPKAGA